MAWFHVEDSTVDAPKHATASWVDRFGRDRLHITKVPTGETTSKTFSVWRCGNCRALAVTAAGNRPGGNCMKCGARG